jgi:hypothetical protein
MSYIFYDPTPERFNTPINYGRLNANKNWGIHTYNLCVLKHIESTTPDVREKIQATKEIVVCQKKIVWWERHPNFIEEEALEQRKQFFGF